PAMVLVQLVTVLPATMLVQLVTVLPATMLVQLVTVLPAMVLVQLARARRRTTQRLKMPQAKTRRNPERNHGAG
ncbi:hypothetical protein, partial [Lelliottia aquatilis]|uniref:hypothetical protein n=1 Tax=Lelliottia aquatilis TaxID=2080838 RepID=UPI001C2D62B7